MPALLAQRLEPSVAPGEHLVRVALVPDVPHDLIARRVEARSAAPPSARRRRAPRRCGRRCASRLSIRRARTSVRQRAQLLARQGLEIRRTIYAFENGHARVVERLRGTHTTTNRARRSSDGVNKSCSRKASHAWRVSASARATAPADAEQRRIGALAQRGVAARRLAQLRRGRRHVQHVVGDLKRQTHGFPVPVAVPPIATASRTRRCRRCGRTPRSAHRSWRRGRAPSPRETTCVPRRPNRGAVLQSCRPHPMHASVSNDGAAGRERQPERGRGVASPHGPRGAPSRYPPSPRPRRRAACAWWGGRGAPRRRPCRADRRGPANTRARSRRPPPRRWHRPRRRTTGRPRAGAARGGASLLRACCT